jgi:hypothetical protein
MVQPTYPAKLVEFIILQLSLLHHRTTLRCCFVPSGDKILNHVHLVLTPDNATRIFPLFIDRLSENTIAGYATYACGFRFACKLA